LVVHFENDFLSSLVYKPEFALSMSDIQPSKKRGPGSQEELPDSKKLRDSGTESSNSFDVLQESRIKEGPMEKENDSLRSELQATKKLHVDAVMERNGELQKLSLMMKENIGIRSDLQTVRAQLDETKQELLTLDEELQDARDRVKRIKNERKTKVLAWLLNFARFMQRWNLIIICVMCCIILAVEEHAKLIKKVDIIQKKAIRYYDALPEHLRPFCKEYERVEVPNPPPSVDSLSISLSKDGQLLALGGKTSNTFFVRIWEVQTGRLLKTLQTTGWPICSFSEDRKLLASSGRDNTTTIWDVERGEEIHVFRGHTDTILGVSFSADGKRFASGGEDKTVRVWNVETGKLITVLTGHTWVVSDVALSHDGALAVSGSWDRTVRIWRVRFGSCMKVLAGHSGPVTSVALSHDGGRVVSGSLDKSMRVWDVSTGKSIQQLGDFSGDFSGFLQPGVIFYTISGHRSLKFTSDGKCVGGKIDRGKTRVWELETGRVVLELGEEGDTHPASMSANGKAFATFHNHSGILLWRHADFDE